MQNYALQYFAVILYFSQKCIWVLPELLLKLLKFVKPIQLRIRKIKSLSVSKKSNNCFIQYRVAIEGQTFGTTSYFFLGNMGNFGKFW
jgi:hypothetical protein